MDEARRHLLKLGVLATASAAVPLEVWCQHLSTSTSTPNPPGNEYDALSYLTAKDFKPFVGATFTAKSQTSGSSRVTLAEVQSPPTLATSTQKTATKPAPNQFALRFKSVSGQPSLKQGTYVFENKSLGRFAMFIVPSAAKAQQMYYTGQVNRSVQ